MKKYLTGVLAVYLLVLGCEKKVNPIDTYYVTVDYKQGSAKDITGNIEVNPKDSIYLNFTISSPNDMSYIEIQRNGVRIDTFQLVNLANKKSFSAVKGYMLDSSAGDYTFRVLARNDKAIFMGDGGKQLKVTVKPDFDFWSYRILQVPDSVSKTNNCYFSSVDGKLYNFTNGATASASIDFGYYWDTTGRGTTATNDDLKHCIYALSAAQPQLGFYDIASWTKNATLLKKMPSSVNFVTGLRSSGAINTLIKGNMTSGTLSKVTLVSTAGGSNVIGFRTVTGKYGAMLIRYVSGDSPNKETQIEIDVKVQK